MGEIEGAGKYVAITVALVSAAIAYIVVLRQACGLASLTCP
jgi:hypothetical protein